MGNVQFQFVKDSRSKLVCISHSGTPFTRYSFDGRVGEFSKKLRLFDDKNQFSFEKGMRYLELMFERELSNQDWRSVFIADKNYPQSGQIVQYFDFNSKKWTPNKPVKPPNAQAETATEPLSFIFKLWVPIYGQRAKVFFSQSGLDTDTGEFNPYQALLSIMAQFNQFKQKNTQRLQPFGKLYGTGEEIYGLDDSPPCLYYFDCETVDVYYHNTKKRIDLYKKALQIYDHPGL